MPFLVLPISFIPTLSCYHLSGIILTVLILLLCLKLNLKDWEGKSFQDKKQEKISCFLNALGCSDIPSVSSIVPIRRAVESSTVRHLGWDLVPLWCPINTNDDENPLLFLFENHIVKNSSLGYCSRDCVCVCVITLFKLY